MLLEFPGSRDLQNSLAVAILNGHETVCAVLITKLQQQHPKASPKARLSYDRNLRKETKNLDLYFPATLRGQAKYTLTSKIGEGSYGVVFACYNCKGGPNGTHYAVKIGFEVRYVNVLSSFRRENKLLKGLQHPSIISQKLFLEDSGTIHLMMEMAHCGPLHEWIGLKKLNGDRLSEEQFKHIFKQMLEAIEYLVGGSKEFI